MDAMDYYTESIGYYAVEYVRVPRPTPGEMVYVYRARLKPTAPFPLPQQRCGNGSTLSEARNTARVCLPGTPWNPKHFWIEVPNQEA